MMCIHKFLTMVGFTICMLVYSREVQCSVIYVNVNARGTANGTSWVNAYSDLQIALAAAQGGDEIWVAAGTYKPTTDSDPAKSFVMPTGVAIYGGFDGTEATRNQRNWNTYQTILSGNLGAPGNISVNSCHVVTGGSQTVLDGFTVTGGNAVNSNGGGMINDSVSTMTVANCTFTGNATSGFGGGMYNKDTGSVTVTNCTFTDNMANDDGGGMENYDVSMTAINCVFANNVATSGGGMFNVNGSVINCIFTGNKSGNDGGGMTVWGGLMTNCIFTSNTAGGVGGGIYNTGRSPIVTNCILWGDGAMDGMEIFNYNGNEAITAINHCDIQGSGGSGSSWNSALGSDNGGNIDSDPQFANAANPGGPDGLWRTKDDGLALKSASPCIHAGNPAGTPLLDILGNPCQGQPDMGAY